MSGIVEVWIGELAKLKEKVVRNKNKSKDGFEEEKEMRRESQKDTTTTLSESTICLLMDRFAPC